MLHAIPNPYLTQGFMARKQQTSLRISIVLSESSILWLGESCVQNPEAYSRVQTKSKDLCEFTFNLLVFMCFWLSLALQSCVCTRVMHSQSRDIADISKVICLLFIGPCIVIYFYSKTNEMHHFFKFIVFCNSTLHVSGDWLLAGTGWNSFPLASSQQKQVECYYKILVK
jgi:hypothetical protein